MLHTSMHRCASTSHASLPLARRYPLPGRFPIPVLQSTALSVGRLPAGASQRRQAEEKARTSRLVPQAGAGAGAGQPPAPPFLHGSWNPSDDEPLAVPTRILQLFLILGYLAFMSHVMFGQETRLQQVLQKMQPLLGAAMRAMELKLGEDMQLLESKLGAKMRALESKLGAKIRWRAREYKLDNHLRSIESELDTEVRVVTSRLDTEVRMMESKLTTELRAQAVEAGLSEKTWAPVLEQMLGREVRVMKARVGAEMQALEQQLVAHVRVMELKLGMQATTQAKAPMAHAFVMEVERRRMCSVETEDAGMEAKGPRDFSAATTSGKE